MTGNQELVQQVEVRNFDMSFGRMVWFMVKWAIAAIPALLILFLIGVAAFIAIGGARQQIRAYQVNAAREELAAAKAEAATATTESAGAIRKLITEGKYMEAYSKAHGAMGVNGVREADRIRLQGLAEGAWRKNSAANGSSPR